MKHSMKSRLPLLIAAFALSSLGTAAAADCFADYKAKQDDPLKLHYGVIEIAGDCTPGNAHAQAATQLSGNGWTLLNILSVFDESGLAQRKDSAGQFYLRY